MPNVTAVCLSATIQKTITFKTFTPEKVNRSEEYIMNASGKALNSARVLNQLEKDFSFVICPVGKDNSKRFFKLAKQDGFTLKGIQIPGSTRECWTLLDRENHKTTELVIGEPVIKIDMQSHTKKLLKAISTSLKTTKALLIAGSRPEIWPQDLSAQICKISSDMNKIVMVDFWGKDLQQTLSLCTPTIIKINEEEFCQTFGYDFPQKEEELQNLICKESQKLNNIIVITRGSEKTLASDKGKPFSEPIQSVEPVNTTGCGDTFSAGFLFEYLKSGDIQSALKLGTKCAALNAINKIPGTIE